MFKYEKSLQYRDIVIDKADMTLDLEAPDDSTYFGVIKLGESVKKPVQFIKVLDRFKGRLIFDHEELKLLPEDPEFYLEVISTTFSKRSNSVRLKIDKKKMGLTAKKNLSEQCLSCMKEMQEINKRMENVIEGNVLKGLTIANRSMIRPGMVPVAIDSKGNFVATWPFADLVREVNGVRAFNETVTITPKEIPFKEGTLQEYLVDVAKTVKEVSTFVGTIAEDVSALNKKLNDIILDVATLMDNDPLGG